MRLTLVLAALGVASAGWLSSVRAPPPPAPPRPTRFLVLGFPVGPSHTFVVGRMARELADRGGDVTYAASKIVAEHAARTVGGRVRLLDLPLASHGEGVLSVMKHVQDSWRSRWNTIFVLGPFQRALAGARGGGEER